MGGVGDNTSIIHDKPGNVRAKTLNTPGHIGNVQQGLDERTRKIHDDTKSILVRGFTALI